MVTTIAALLLLATAPARSDFAISLASADSLIRPGETHFAHLWRFKDDAYCPRWSPDSRNLIMDVSGEGWPAYLGKDAFVSSCDSDSFVPTPPRWRVAKWPLHPTSQLRVVRGLSSPNDYRILPQTGAIESNSSPDGKQIVYTATPAIDPELYIVNEDGSNVRRLTVDQGYDGGGAFSPDGQLICYQAFHPRLETDKAIYTDLLAKHLVDTSTLDIWMMHADGSGRGQVTDLEGTSMEPSFTPDSKRIIFSSDYQDVPGRQFDLYITKLDGGTPEKITNDPSPDCFPAFSPNGRYLAFTSGRGSKTADAQTVFIAEWK